MAEDSPVDECECRMKESIYVVGIYLGGIGLRTMKVRR